MFTLLSKDINRLITENKKRSIFDHFWLIISHTKRIYLAAKVPGKQKENLVTYFWLL